MGKSPCCSNEKVELKKGPWTPEEDQKLTDYIQKHGHGRWRTLPNNAGLKRCGKSCRLRWINYLRPDIKRGRFSFEEEDTIIQLHSVLGNKWSIIASHLPGRTDNEIKNYWNTHIRKKLLKMGIDPVTHAPCLDLLELSSLLSSALYNLSSYQLNTDLPNHHDQLGINQYNQLLFKHPQVVQNSSSILQLQNNPISDVQTTATSTGVGQLISQNLSNLLSSYSPNSYLWQNNRSEASITPNESFLVPLQQNHGYKDLVTTPNSYNSTPLNSNSPTNYVNCSSNTTEEERDSFYHNILMYDISTNLNHTNQLCNN